MGNKKTLTCTSTEITRVPEHILTDELSAHRTCVAQVMSWVADRTTTRVEDGAHSLMTLLDLNMMLYGEGKKAFQRLQLEIMRTFNDKSIFAWGCSAVHVRVGSILANGPSFFRNCHFIGLLNHDEFI